MAPKVAVALVAFCALLNGCSKSSALSQSATNKATCAAFQDSLDDVRAAAGTAAIEGDLERALQIATEGSNTELQNRSRAARIAMGVYAAKRSDDPFATSQERADAWVPVESALVAGYQTCADIGLTMRL